MNNIRKILIAMSLFLIGACGQAQEQREFDKSRDIGTKEADMGLHKDTLTGLEIFDRQPMVFMWQVQKRAPDGDFEYLAGQGVNAVMAFRMATWSDNEVQRYLDGALQVGIRVAAYLGIYREGEDEQCGFSQKAIDFVNKFKSHPALFAWHTVDEPAEHNVSIDCQRNLYQTVKKLDPARPIMISANNNSRRRYREYFSEDTFDILEMHKYVNPRPVEKSKRLLNLFKEVRTREYPVILTLRAFNSPHKPRRIDMVPGSLAEQYEFFVNQAEVSRHYGFYGWELSPNKGIKQIPALKEEFEAFMKSRREDNR